MTAIDASIVQKTRESLGSLIKKPPLTEKLLSRPPFRFLHDIFTELIKHTGFFHGLYSPEELNSENVKDKASKVAFLQKAIDVVAFTLGRQVSCRPNKVVAGHEPEKTNEFLQLLAAAIIDKRDCSDAVTRVLNGEKPTNESLSAERKSGTGKVKPEDAKGQSRSHSREKEKDWKNGKETEERRAEEKGGGKKERRKERAGDKDGQRNRDREKSKNKVKKNDQELANGLVPNGDVIMNGPVGSESQEPQQRIPRPTSAKGSRTRTTANDSDGEIKHRLLVISYNIQQGCISLYSHQCIIEV
jgi:TRAF3-interacting protein 1